MLPFVWTMTAAVATTVTSTQVITSGEDDGRSFAVIVFSFRQRRYCDCVILSRRRKFLWVDPTRSL
jgi:hypothetical protein